MFPYKISNSILLIVVVCKNSWITLIPCGRKSAGIIIPDATIIKIISKRITNVPVWISLQTKYIALNISDNNIEHIIRTLRGFLEGFVLLVNNNAFGNPISIKESFDLSLDIIFNGMKSLEGVE